MPPVQAVAQTCTHLMVPAATTVLPQSPFVVPAASCMTTSTLSFEPGWCQYDPNSVSVDRSSPPQPSVSALVLLVMSACYWCVSGAIGLWRLWSLEVWHCGVVPGLLRGKGSLGPLAVCVFGDCSRKCSQCPGIDPPSWHGHQLLKSRLRSLEYHTLKRFFKVRHYHRVQPCECSIFHCIPRRCLEIHARAWISRKEAARPRIRAKIGPVNGHAASLHECGPSLCAFRRFARR
jgi:hypothetical protein